jgi:hypothetical protein
MTQSYSKGVSAILESYGAYFDPPAEVLPFHVKSKAASDLAIAVCLPQDPGGVTTMGTAGLSAWPIAADFNAELAIEIKDSVEPEVRRKLAQAIVDMGTAPLQTGRPFIMGQTLGNVTLPLFERFGCAMLIDWDPVYGFEFPNLPEPVTLLRIVPLFDAEAKWVEKQRRREDAFLSLFNSGLVPEDYDREPIDVSDL